MDGDMVEVPRKMQLDQFVNCQCIVQRSYTQSSKIALTHSCLFGTWMHRMAP